MSQDKLSKAVERELEDYKRLESIDAGEFFRKSNIKKKFKIVLFQVPKNFDISSLEGQEIALEGNETQILKEDDDENVIVERLDEQSENYVSNQVLPLIPSKESKLTLSKKISKVYKIYTRYNTKKIRKKNIIKQKPLYEDS